VTRSAACCALYSRRLEHRALALRLAFVALFFLAAHSARAQSSITSEIGDCPAESSSPLPTLTYDVASIRPHPPEDGSLSFSNSRGARFDITGVSMKNLLSEAYGVSLFQVSGPAWIDSQRFDVHARGDASTDAVLAALPACQASKVKKQMLRTLLVDRVKLSIHRVTKDAPGYNLVVAKGGPKLQESKPAPPADPSGPPSRQHGAGMETSGTRLGTQLTAREYTMPMFASWLVLETKGPVADKTGLAAKYDIKLQWSDDDTRPPSSGDPPYPTLNTALQEQLGLKLESVKIPQDTIVIDHIEQPSEN
jgi:uncharacterized protein (TIGR03435 family)